jgi:predicted protein tyrosine phosphatase
MVATHDEQDDAEAARYYSRAAKPHHDLLALGRVAQRRGRPGD